MSKMAPTKVVFLLLFTSLGLADVRDCACDPSKPETMSSRECGLCREADKLPPREEIFFLKDINPRKPNRWLAQPRAHAKIGHALEDYPAALRLKLWNAAIQKAKELWGDEWGVAMNGDEMRTQCHAHIHIGKLLKGVELENFIVVADPSEIPLPKDGDGLWVHPAGTKLHVHVGEQICETVLMR